MAQYTVFYQKIERIFDQKSGALVMGILNVTPDSFYDGGKYTEEQQWLSHVSLMVNAGADMIDIGAYSTRPGAEEVSAEVESERLIKVIRSVRNAYPDLLLSADTFRSQVAKDAVAAGANIINDISGGTLDSEMFSVIAALNVPYILMHIQGSPQNMQDNPKYSNVVEEVYAYFENKLKQLNALGIKQVIIDPGFGFGKTLEHNYELLKNMDRFAAFGLPVLAGISRKSMVNKLLNINPKDSLNGTSILNTIALQKGASLLRVHDVKEAKEAVAIVEFMKSMFQFG
jgi:dihydropteroate synthase